MSLFGKRVSIIWDGTYFYAGKASSYGFQRSSYSGRKKCHLVKFMSSCLVDGYCSDTLGLRFETTNDATIINHRTTTKNALEGQCKAADEMIVDRGFTYVAEALSHLGYEPKMPIHPPKEQKQCTTKEANEVRLISNESTMNRQILPCSTKTMAVLF